MATRSTRKLFGVQIIDEEGQVLSLDVLRSEAPTFAGKLSEHPIEGGGVVADHYSNDADTLTLDIVQGEEPALGAEDTGRPLATLERLNALKRSGAVLRVVSGLRVYPSMVIESISVTRTSATGRVLNASLTLKQAVFAVAAEVVVPEALRSARNRGMAEARERGLANSDEVGVVAGGAQASATAQDRASSSSSADASSRDAASGASRPTPEQNATARKDTGSLLQGWF